MLGLRPAVAPSSACHPREAGGGEIFFVNFYWNPTMQNNEFEYFTYEVEHELDGYVNVYGWCRHEESSVLAGQPRKVFMATFSDVREALSNYPNAYDGHPAFEPCAQVPVCPPADWSPDDAGESWDDE